MIFHFLCYCFLAHQQDFFLYSSPRILAPSLIILAKGSSISTKIPKSCVTFHRKKHVLFPKRWVFLATVWISEILLTYGPHWMEQLIEGLVASLRGDDHPQCSVPTSLHIFPRKNAENVVLKEGFPVFGVVLNVPGLWHSFHGKFVQGGVPCFMGPIYTISLYLACSWSYQRTFVSMKLYSLRIPALDKCFSTNKPHKPNMCLPNKPHIGHHGHGVDQIFFISTFCWTQLPLNGGVMYIYYIYIYTIYIHIHPSQILNHLPRSAEAGF